MWFKNHLKEAAKYSRTKTGFLFYFRHMLWALHMSGVFIIWSVAMLIHAFIPQLVGFTVLNKLVDLLKNMKKQHPDDPLLSKIKFDE